MKKVDGNLEYFKTHHREIYDAYQNFGKTLHEKGGPLDEKTRWLIKVVVSATSEYPYALQTHINKALQNGCTKEEIEHALLLIAPTAGFPKTMEGIMALREETK